MCTKLETCLILEHRRVHKEYQHIIEINKTMKYTKKNDKSVHIISP